MNPKDFGLDPADRDNHEVISMYMKNVTREFERGTRAGIADLLRKRRHEDRNLISLALLGGLPPALDSILSANFNSASAKEIPELVKTSRRLQNQQYPNIAGASETVRLYCLAHAAVTIERSMEHTQSPLYAYRRLERGLPANMSPDIGLHDIFTRNLAARRALNRKNANLQDITAVRIPEGDKQIRAAYHLLSDLASDGLTDRYSLDQAVRAAGMLATLLQDKASVPAAAALLDLGNIGTRNEWQLDDVEEKVGKDVADLLKKHCVRHIKSPEKFKAADDQIKMVAVVAFVALAAQKMGEIQHYESIGRYKPEMPVIRSRVERLHKAEERARNDILPHINLVPSADLQTLFGHMLDDLTVFNVMHPLPAPPPPQLPPAAPPRPQ